MKDQHKTVVIFRKVPANYSSAYPEIIALFPEIPATNNPRECLSYVHYGQHGAAMASGHNWKAATPEEYAPLKKELEIIGYNLDVRNRSCPAYFQRRLQALKN
jgi:hypothetical protein